MSNVLTHNVAYARCVCSYSIVSWCNEFDIDDLLFLHQTNYPTIREDDGSDGLDDCYL